MSAKISFKKVDRFDAIRAEKGVPHNMTMNNGEYLGTITTSLFDQNTKITRLALERFQRDHANDPDAKGKHGGIYAFVMVCVHDWTGVEDADGNEVPFSKDAAFQYLTHNIEEDAWLSEELIKRSSNDAYYQKVGDPRASKKAAAGN